MLSTINKFHSKFSPCISGILKTSHQQFCHGLKFHCFWVVITIIFRYITLKMTKSITMFFLLSRHAPISAAAFLYHQGSKFSARGLKSAPERSNLTIFEISVNLVRKYFAQGGRGINGLESVVKEFFGIITGSFRRNSKSFLKFSLKWSNFRRQRALLNVCVLNPKREHRTLPVSAEVCQTCLVYPAFSVSGVSSQPLTQNKKLVKVGQNQSHLVHRAKLVTNGQVTNLTVVKQ